MINFVTFVLDETGSMFGIKADTIGGFNTFLEGLNEAASPETPTWFTFIKFNSSEPHLDFVHKEVAIGGVPKLTDRAYQPSNTTPLIDACCEAILLTDRQVADKDARVHIAIQTDGLENASREHTLEELRKLIADRREKGWLFTFLGAGEQAFAQGKSFGVDPNFTMNYSRNKSKAAFASASRVAREYTSEGVMNAFTVDERKSADDSKS